MRTSTSLASIALTATLSSSSRAFQFGTVPPISKKPYCCRRPSSTTISTASTTSQSSYSSSSSSCLRYSNWDAFEAHDAMEVMIGGTRYETVELPDSMMSTTLWVGNLCEFVTDETLSELFQRASDLKFVPACVARKPNMESLRYGFVTFRSEEEKEIAMELLHGYELQGKPLKVECIKDHERHGRIRAPRKIVDYAVGPVKRRRNGELNTLRRATAGMNSGGEDDDDCGGGAGERRGGERRGRHNERDSRRMRAERRKTRGRYKNQQRKNSRMPRL